MDNYYPQGTPLEQSGQQPQFQQQSYQQQQYQQPYQQPNQQKDQLQVSDTVLYHLRGASKWIKTIGIIATIMLVIMVLLGIYALISLMNVGGDAAGAGIGIFIGVLILGAIYIFPILKSYGVGNHIKNAIMTHDQYDLEEGLHNLNSLATYMGVLAIIGIVFFIIYVIAIVGFIIQAQRVAAAASYMYY